MDLNTTKLKDLPDYFREMLDCDAALKIKLEAIQLLKKTMEMTMQKFEGFSRPPRNTINMVEKEMEVYDRYLLLAEDSIKLNGNMEITYAERLQLTKEYGLTEIEILEDLISCKKRVDRYLFMIKGCLETDLKELTEVPPLPPGKMS